MNASNDKHSLELPIFFEDGVYFGLDEDAYHSDPALGSGDVKNLIQGAEVYWAQTPMNPLYDGDQGSSSKTRGKAYHKYILEGVDRFAESFAVLPEKEDFPNALVTADQIKETLLRFGESQSGTKAVLIKRLKKVHPNAVIWDLIVERFKEMHAGKEFISAKQMNQIRYDARFIERNEHLKNAFFGGFPEVSIFWTTDDGVRCKCRIDYLKISTAVDLKTYTNPRRQRADIAIHDTAARFGHDIQAAHYRPGLALSRTLPWFEMSPGSLPPQDFENAYRKTKNESEFFFVYQCADSIPMARAKRMSWELETVKFAETQVENALVLYQQCFDEFGADPWIIPEAPTDFEDEAFPLFRR